MTKYDVGISFLSGELLLAQEIRDGLSGHLSVFVYSHNQEDVAGTDGIETFRAVFRSDARIVVILYRDGWGGTPWTRVEAEAIKDRILADGPDFLFVITLDAASKVPRWIPERMIRLSLADFGVEQAVGAIKARARESGIAFRKESVVDRAKRTDEMRAFEADRQRLLRDDAGVNAANSLAKKLFAVLSAHARDVQQSTPALAVHYGADDNQAVIRAGKASVTVYWKQRYTNTLSESSLIVSKFKGQVMLPGQNGFYWGGEPKQLEEVVYLPDLMRGVGWCWKDKTGKPHDSDEVADRVMKMFFELVDEASAGKLADLE